MAEISPVDNEIMPGEAKLGDHHLTTDSSAPRSSPPPGLSPLTPNLTPTKADIHNFSEEVKASPIGIAEIPSFDDLQQKKNEDQRMAAFEDIRVSLYDDTYEEEVIDDSEEIVEEYEEEIVEEVVEDDYSEETIEDDSLVNEKQDLPTETQPDEKLNPDVEVIADSQTEPEMSPFEDKAQASEVDVLKPDEPVYNEVTDRNHDNPNLEEHANEKSSEILIDDKPQTGAKENALETEILADPALVPENGLESESAFASEPDRGLALGVPMEAEPTGDLVPLELTSSDTTVLADTLPVDELQAETSNAEKTTSEPAFVTEHTELSSESLLADEKEGDIVSNVQAESESVDESKPATELASVDAEINRVDDSTPASVEELTSSDLTDAAVPTAKTLPSELQEDTGAKNEANNVTEEQSAPEPVMELIPAEEDEAATETRIEQTGDFSSTAAIGATSSPAPDAEALIEFTVPGDYVQEEMEEAKLEADIFTEAQPKFESALESNEVAVLADDDIDQAGNVAPASAMDSTSDTPYAEVSTNSIVTSDDVQEKTEHTKLEADIVTEAQPIFESAVDPQPTEEEVEDRADAGSEQAGGVIPFAMDSTSSDTPDVEVPTESTVPSDELQGETEKVEHENDNVTETQQEQLEFEVPTASIVPSDELQEVAVESEHEPDIVTEAQQEQAEFESLVETKVADKVAAPKDADIEQIDDISPDPATDSTPSNTPDESVPTESTLPSGEQEVGVELEADMIAEVQPEFEASLETKVAEDAELRSPMEAEIDQVGDALSAAKESTKDVAVLAESSLQGGYLQAEIEAEPEVDIITPEQTEFESSVETKVAENVELEAFMDAEINQAGDLTPASVIDSTSRFATSGLLSAETALPKDSVQEEVEDVRELEIAEDAQPTFESSLVEPTATEVEFSEEAAIDETGDFSSVSAKNTTFQGDQLQDERHAVREVDDVSEALIQSESLVESKPAEKAMLEGSMDAEVDQTGDVASTLESAKPTDEQHEEMETEHEFDKISEPESESEVAVRSKPAAEIEFDAKLEQTGDVTTAFAVDSTGNTLEKETDLPASEPQLETACDAKTTSAMNMEAANGAQPKPDLHYADERHELELKQDSEPPLQLETVASIPVELSGVLLNEENTEINPVVIPEDMAVADVDRVEEVEFDTVREAVAPEEIEVALMLEDPKGCAETTPVQSLDNTGLSTAGHVEDEGFDAECKEETLDEAVGTSAVVQIADETLQTSRHDETRISMERSDEAAPSHVTDILESDLKDESVHLNIESSDDELVHHAELDSKENAVVADSAENEGLDYTRSQIAVVVLADQPRAEQENQDFINEQAGEEIFFHGFGFDGAENDDQQASVKNIDNVDSVEHDALRHERDHITTAVLAESMANIDNQEIVVKSEEKEVTFYSPDCERGDIEPRLFENDDGESKGSQLQECNMSELYEVEESNKRRCDRVAIIALACAICLILVALAAAIPIFLVGDDDTEDRDISFPTSTPDEANPTVAPKPRYELASGPFEDNPNNGFGRSVSFDSGLLLVGLPSEGKGTVRSFLISQTGDMLSTGDILGEQEGSGFGWSVDVAGTMAAIGSPFLFIEDTPTEAGGVYVYEYNGSGWSQVGETLRGDGDLYAANEAFGSVISLSITDSVYRVVVGAPISNLNDFEIGRVYTFEMSAEDGSGWVGIEATALLGERAGDRFGSSVAISKDGSTFIAGGPGGELHDDPGLVFVYEYTGKTEEAWELVFSISGSEENERFGASVAMLSDNGDTFAIGAPDYESGSGRIVVYRKEGGGFYQQLGADIVGERGERIGEQRVLGGSASGDSVQIVAGTATGRVLRYDYSEESQSWSILFDELDPELSGVSSISVAGVNSATIAIGSEIDGAVTIYATSGGDDGVNSNSEPFPSATSPAPAPTSAGTAAPFAATPAPTATLLEWSMIGGPFTIDTLQSGYGSSISMSDSQVAVGAPFAGLVKLYGVETNGSWSESSELTGDESSDGFGYAVDIDGQSMLVGAPLAGGEGAAYYFENGSGQWIQIGSNGFFGSSVAISASQVGIVGAVGFSGDGLIGRGAAYIFSFSDGWTMTGSQLGIEAGDSLGHAVDIDSSGTMALLGAPGTKGGYAIVLEKNGSDWETTLLIRGENDGDGFGTSVKVLSPYHVAVGAPGYSQGRGRVVVYQRVRGTFEEMVDVVGDEGDELGSTLKLAGSGTTLLLGRADGFVKRLEFDSANAKWIQTAELVDSGFGSGLQALATPSEDPGRLAASGAEKAIVYGLV